MIIIELTYQVPLDEIDRLIPAHREHLDRQYERGMFLSTGRQEPRTGGIILATGTLDEVRAAESADPFLTSGAATARYIEFVPSRVSPNLASAFSAG